MLVTSINETVIHALLAKCPQRPPAGKSSGYRPDKMTKRGQAMSNTILIVDDDPVQRRLLEAATEKAGYATLIAENGGEALSILTGKPGKAVAAVILDLMMPEIDGMAVLQALRDKKITKPVIIQTARGGIETVVSAMRLGAFDFVVKPVAPEKLQRTIANAIRFKGSREPAEKSRHRGRSPLGFKDMASSSPAMNAALAVGAKAAGSQIPVMIEGESGVGKELLARAIQSAGERAGKPFVTVNCGALPENLVESILFGHEKGAFTGATDKHVGKFEEANGGTLFLDEIGELPLDLQVKLLRAIQEGEIDPVGSRRPVQIDIRLISATNRDLYKEVQAGRFREDLYYRLNVLAINLPPLRERREDIEPLVYRFVKQIGAEEDRGHIDAVDPAAMAALKVYDWPGNIRELENTVFRAMVLCDDDRLTEKDFPQILAQLPGFELGTSKTGEAEPVAPSITTPEIPVVEDRSSSAVPANRAADSPLIGKGCDIARGAAALPATGLYGMTRLISDEGQIRTLEEIEAETIRFAIEIYNGRMSEVARRLGIGRSTLYRKLKEYGIDGEEDTESAIRRTA